MRTTRSTPVLAPLVCVLACAPARAPDDAERRAIAASVDSATRAFEQAQRARDADRVIAHLAPDFYMYADGARVDYDAVVAGMRGTFPTIRHVEPGFADVDVKVLGRDAALVSLRFRDSVTTIAGELRHHRGATTLVWERRGGDWLLTYADADHHPVGPDAEPARP